MAARITRTLSRLKKWQIRYLFNTTQQMTGSHWSQHLLSTAEPAMQSKIQLWIKARSNISRPMAERSCSFWYQINNGVRCTLLSRIGRGLTHIIRPGSNTVEFGFPMTRLTTCEIVSESKQTASSTRLILFFDIRVITMC